MTVELKPSYKQTEIGLLPEDWEVVILKEAAEINKESVDPTREFPDEDFLYIDIDSIENEAGVIRSVKGVVGKDAPSRARRVIRKNDVLMSTVRPYLKAFAIVPEKYDGQICSTGFAVLSCKAAFLPRFLLYVLFSKPFLDQCNRVMVGGQYPALNSSQVERIRIPHPPKPEQEKIAEILSTVDEGIGKVDEAIQKTERLRKGLMQKLLTKGIGHKEFRDTELGNIPKGWKLARISDIGEVKGGKRLPKGHNLVEHKTQHPYIRVVDFKNMSVDASNIRYLPRETYDLIKSYTISSNDAYISIAGTVGLAGTVPRELDGANLTENAAKLCNLRSVTNEFLAYALNSRIGQSQVLSLVGKAQQPKLALFRIEKIKVPLPPILEQKKITEILDAVDEKLKLLRERREKLERVKKGLMNDLLTGKRRVKVVA